jgi:ligand-binding sensor domain-containing protein/putative methionine-R-sulfoxide reductase with GAF domain
LKRSNLYPELMKLSKRIFLINLILFFDLTFFFSWAQLPLRDFYFKHLKTEQGLSNGRVQHLMKDREGFLWIATYNGLNCFDGSHFKTWKADPSQKDKLQNSQIYSLCEDDLGNIWCAAALCVSRYDKKTNKFENYTLFQTKSGANEYGTLLNIIKCRNGLIVTQSNAGIYIYDSLQNNFIHYDGDTVSGAGSFTNMYMNAFMEDPRKEGIWFGTDKGMRYFDLEKKIYYSSKNNPLHLSLFDDHRIYPVTLDNNKHMVYGDVTNTELVTYDPSQNRLTRTSVKSWNKDEPYFTCILIDRENNRWLSSFKRHLYFEDGKTGKVYEFRNNVENSYSVAGNFVNCIMQDADGTIYLGTDNGVSITNPSQNFFSIFQLPDTIQHRKHYSQNMLLNCDKQNNVWCAPSNQYLLKYNTEAEKFTSYNIITSKKFKDTDIKISAMEPDHDKLYFGTIDGIYVYDVKSDAFERLRSIPDSEKVSGNYILEMLLTRDHELWFTNHRNGVFRYNVNTHKYRHYILDNKDSTALPENFIYDIHEDLTGTIWFISEHRGLIKYNPVDDNFENVSRNKSFLLPDQIYTKMTHDAQNNLWILNYATGLTRYNPGTGEVKVMTSANGLSNLAYHYLFTDNNNLWLGCYHEYSILNLNTLTADNFIIDYYKNSNEYINHFSRLGSDRIVSETRDGFITFNTKNRTPNNRIESITISNFTAGNLKLPFADEQTKINLSYSQNFFSFDFSTLSFLKNPNIKFEYQLEGLDKNWIDCGARQTVYYTNLNGGDYTFKVRAGNGNGIWTESKKPVNLYVSSIYYATIWFKLILAGLLFTLIYWYYRLWKRKELNEKSEEAISYFANSVSGKNKVEEIVWDITHNVIARSDFVDCVVYLLDENKNVLVQKAAFGNKNPEAYEILNPIEIPIGQGIVGTVAQTGIAEIVNDTSKDKRYIADDASRLSELAVPIKYKEKVIGVIDSEHPKKRFFTNEHLELMTTIASITGTKIVNAQKEIAISENERRMDELKLQMAYTRQQALRAQMNPHFIFNCLNSINGFILQNDAQTASTFLIKFSKLIRLILEHSNEKSITLQNELDALKLYIEMEMLRFEKKFSYEIKIDSNVAAESVMVPPLIFQPFIENSIWHGLLHKETSGTLLVHIDYKENILECIVEDNGIGREMSATYKSKTSAHKKSLGLQLTRERLAIMNEQEKRKSSVEVIDLKNGSGIASGTRVVIKMECHNDN